MDSYSNLSDTEIRERLKSHGFNPGPITDSTKSLYLKKLINIDQEKSSNKAFTNTISPFIRNLKNEAIKNKINYSYTNIKTDSPDRLPQNKSITKSPVNVINYHKFSRVQNKTEPLTPIYNANIVEHINYDELSQNPENTLHDDVHELEQKEQEKTKIQHLESKTGPGVTIKPSESVIKRIFNCWPTSASTVDVVKPCSIGAQQNDKTTDKGVSKKRFNSFSIPSMKYLLYFFMIPLIFAFLYSSIFYAVSVTRLHWVHLPFAFLIIILLIPVTFFVKYLYLKYKLRKQAFIKEKYLCIDKVLELVNERLCDYKKGVVESPYIPVAHIRDILFPPSERKSKGTLWNEVQQFVSKNESRIRTEVQRISGQDFQVWKWIGIPLEPNPLPCPLSDQISPSASFYDSLSSFLKIYIGQSPCPGFYEITGNLIKDIKRQNLIVIKHDSFPSKSVVYLKMGSKEDAIQVFNRFNKSNKFGFPLKVKFMAEYSYNQRFE